MAALALATLIASTPAAAQSPGNVGGTIGKKTRSVSGETPAPRTTKSRKAVASARPAGETKSKRCPNIVGTWNSWATSLFGAGDAVFRSDGTATHRSGIPGKWSCEDGQLRLGWSNSKTEVIRLSADRKQIICTNGSICFSKD